MITKLLPNRPVIRETEARDDQSDPLIVELFPKWIEIRSKRKKSRITITYEEILRVGRKITWKTRRAS